MFFITKGSLCISLLVGLGPLTTFATTPSLIFSGGADRQHVVALEQYNRISFGNESMTLTHSDNPSASLELPYTSYNLFTVGEAEPTASISDEFIPTSAEQFSLFVFDASTRSLISTASEPMNVRIYNASGQCLKSAYINPGESISVISLSAGIYFAVAEQKSNNSFNTIKFFKQ